MNRGREFDPERDVPQDDEEAEASLTYGITNPIWRAALVGVFRCRRAAGEDLYTAAIATLKQAVKAAGVELEA